MQIVVDLDDKLLAHARTLMGIEDVSEIVREALVEREVARDLDEPGGSEEQIRHIPRRRSPITNN